MSTITTNHGVSVYGRGKLTARELEALLAQRRAQAAAARKHSVRRKGDGKGSRHQVRRSAAW